MTSNWFIITLSHLPFLNSKKSPFHLLHFLLMRHPHKTSLLAISFHKFFSVSTSKTSFQYCSNAYYRSPTGRRKEIIVVLVAQNNHKRAADIKGLKYQYYNLRPINSNSDIIRDKIILFISSSHLSTFSPSYQWRLKLQINCTEEKIHHLYVSGKR